MPTNRMIFVGLQRRDIWEVTYLLYFVIKTIKNPYRSEFFQIELNKFKYPGFRNIHLIYIIHLQIQFIVT